MTPVALGLGSNLGDREEQLRRALERLARCCRLERASSVYLTEPVGFREQEWFLNCAAIGWTSIPPRQLLGCVKNVELELGRRPTFPNGPRTIDIDLLLYGQETLKEEGIEIPHARMHQRRFVLEPLAEIAGDWRHPRLEQTIDELLAALPAAEEVKLASEPLWRPPQAP